MRRNPAALCRALLVHEKTQLAELLRQVHKDKTELITMIVPYHHDYIKSIYTYIYPAQPFCPLPCPASAREIANGRAPKAGTLQQKLQSRLELHYTVLSHTNRVNITLTQYKGHRTCCRALLVHEKTQLAEFLRQVRYNKTPIEARTTLQY